MSHDDQEKSKAPGGESGAWDLEVPHGRGEMRHFGGLFMKPERLAGYIDLNQSVPNDCVGPQIGTELQVSEAELSV